MFNLRVSKQDVASSVQVVVQSKHPQASAHFSSYNQLAKCYQNMPSHNFKVGGDVIYGEAKEIMKEKSHGTASHPVQKIYAGKLTATKRIASAVSIVTTLNAVGITRRPHSGSKRRTKRSDILRLGIREASLRCSTWANLGAI